MTGERPVTFHMPTIIVIRCLRMSDSAITDRAGAPGQALRPTGS